MRTPRNSFRKQLKRNIPWTPLLQESSSKKKKRDWISAISITLMVHMLLIFFLPKVWKPTNIALTEKSPLELEFELKSSDQYVETNPAVEVEEPPRTPYFASRAQLAAQLDPTSAKKEMVEPAIDGEAPLSQKIVQTPKDIFEEKEFTEPEPMVIPQDSSDENMLAKEMTALPAVFEEKEVSDATSGIALAKEKQDLTNLIQKDFQPPIEKPVGDTENNFKERRPQPRPRPRVEHASIPAPLRKSYGSTSRLGQTAISARFSEYGAYLDRLFESIYYQWRLLLTNYKFLAEDYGSVVEVRFTLNKDGNIRDVKVVQATGSSIAAFICKDSICSLEPFDGWTEQMVKTLGEEQELGIVFHFR